jgi:SagB-type dehydrogenase family enzyme
MQVPSTDPMALSLLFHLNSEPWRNDAAYAGAGRQERLHGLGGEPLTPLPAPEPSALGELLAARRSTRAFALEPLPLSAVSALAAAALGIVETLPLDDGTSLVRRGAPSAGGLFPLDLYVFARRVEGLADGVYVYDDHAHALSERALGDPTALLAQALYAFPFVAGANLLLALVARFARMQSKYGPRGYRYILLEAGHAAQNVCLRATELGLASLCIGGFVDSALNAALGLRDTEAGVVYALAAGHHGVGE